MIENISCVILAGGASSRMKTNKALLPFNGKPVINIMVEILKESIRDIIVVTDNPELFSIDGVRYTYDKLNYDTKNSLVGIYSGIIEAYNDYSLVLPCDMPFVNIKLIKYMAQRINGNDVIVPYLDGFYEPLYSIYSKASLIPILDLLEKRRYKITDVFPKLKVQLVNKDEILFFDKELLCFLNLNTLEDYERAKNIWSNK